MIEALVVSFAVMTVLSVLGAVIYYGVVHTGMNYLLHEFLVCKLTQGETQCREEFKKKSTPFLFASRILVFESFDAAMPKARLVLQMPLKKTLTLKKDLKGFL